MTQAFVFIEAEPGRVQELVKELAGMELASSVIKQVYAVTGRCDLIALIESPDRAGFGPAVAGLAFLCQSFLENSAYVQLPG